MSKLLTDYIRAEKSKSNDKYRPVPAIACLDGLTLSVQASEFTYCSPRDNYGPWDMFEVGFPSQKIEELMEYAETPANPTGTVYGYVPGDVIEKVIAAHGGMTQEDVSC